MRNRVIAAVCVGVLTSVLIYFGFAALSTPVQAGNLDPCAPCNQQAAEYCGDDYYVEYDHMYIGWMNSQWCKVWCGIGPQPGESPDYTSMCVGVDCTPDHDCD